MDWDLTGLKDISHVWDQEYTVLRAMLSTVHAVSGWSKTMYKLMSSANERILVLISLM